MLCYLCLRNATTIEAGNLVVEKLVVFGFETPFTKDREGANSIFKSTLWVHHDKKISLLTWNLLSIE
jgi:hypothetical protein